MLLGVAQVVVNAADLAGEARRLRAGGFTETFAERGIPNHPAKAPLQARPRAQLDMVHFAAPDGGVAVEVTQYAGEPPSGRAPYELELPAAGGRTRVRLACADPVASVAFWCDGLGFADQHDGLLLLRAIRPEWTLEVELAQEAAGKTAIDAGGCVLVTMLSTALEDDFASLRDRVPESRSAPPWDERIAGRTLRVAMIEGPSGELIELLQPPTDR